MKIIVLLLIFGMAFAEVEVKETEKTENAHAHEGPHGHKKLDKKSVSEAAYKKAKLECLAENKELKGIKLKDCIVNKQKEAK